MRVEIRSNSVEVSGYVNATGRDSQPLADHEGYFVERVEPGAFARALERNRNVPMLLNHDPGRVLATPGSGLELREDAVGLYARAVVTDPEVIDEARRGRLRGWSFGFRALRQTDGEQGGLRHRTLREIELREVSLLDVSRVPAYPATSVFTRDDGEEVEVRTMQDLVETSEEAPPAPDLSPWTDVVRELEQRAL